MASVSTIESPVQDEATGPTADLLHLVQQATGVDLDLFALEGTALPEAGLWVLR